MQESYHPIIEDRLAEVESRLSRQMTSEQALDVIKETLVFLTLRTSQVEEAMIVAGHGSNQSFASLVYDLNQARSDLRSKTK
jgi:hypothetical protein